MRDFLCTNWLRALAAGVVSTMLACSADTSDATRSAGSPTIGTPLFEFKPGPPGRAVGIRAIAELPSGDVQSYELEIKLLDPAPKAATAALKLGPPARPSSTPVPEVGVASAALCSTSVGEQPERLEAHNGAICWLASSFAAGVGLAQTKYTAAVIFAREGLYHTIMKADEQYFPPNLVGVGYEMAFACADSPDGAQASSELLGDLQGFGFTVDITPPAIVSPTAVIEGGISVGVGFFLLNDSLHDAFQVTTGIGTSIGTLSSIGPIGASREVMNTVTKKPRLIYKFDDACAHVVTPAEGGHLAAQAWQKSDDPVLSEVGESMGPLLEHMAQKGHPAARHVPGSANNLLPGSTQVPEGESCEGCPASSFDELRAQVSEQIVGRSLGEVVRPEHPVAGLVVGSIPSVLPNPDLFTTLLRRAEPAMKLLLRVNNRGTASPADGRYFAKNVITVEVAPGEKAKLVYALREIAELVGWTEADVMGATLKLDGSPALDPATYVLDKSELMLSFSPKDTTPIAIIATVDLTTAKGARAAETKGWSVEVATRLVKPKAGPAMKATITAPARVASGGAITLNAVVRDANNNPVDEPARVRFEDGDGVMLGMAETKHGFASIQYVPEPSAPILRGVEYTDLQIGDTVLPGIELLGSGFSGAVEILVNGTPLPADDPPRQVKSSSEILLALDPAPGTTIAVRNPGGLTSSEATFQ